METVYSSIKRMKEDAMKYLKKGYFNKALETYRNLGEKRKAARLSACLERTGGKKREACKKYLRGRFIRQQLLEGALITSLGTLASVGVFSGADGYLKSMEIDNSRFEPRMELAEKYTEQIPPEKELPLVPLGAVVGGAIGLWAAFGNYNDNKPREDNSE